MVFRRVLYVCELLVHINIGKNKYISTKFFLVYVRRLNWRNRVNFIKLNIWKFLVVDMCHPYQRFQLQVNIRSGRRVVVNVSLPLTLKSLLSNKNDFLFIFQFF